MNAGVYIIYLPYLGHTPDVGGLLAFSHGPRNDLVYKWGGQIRERAKNHGDNHEQRTAMHRVKDASTVTCAGPHANRRTPSIPLSRPTARHTLGTDTPEIDSSAGQA